MKNYYEEIAKREAVTQKRYALWEAHPSTRPINAYDYIRMHD